MNTKEMYARIFNAEAMAKVQPAEDMCQWVFAIGVQEGMRQAAKVLDGVWFKSQHDCAEAIRRAAKDI